MRLNIAVQIGIARIACKREARQHRAEIGKEARFQGAKDGAIRFAQLANPIAQELERYVLREERAI